MSTFPPPHLLVFEPDGRGHAHEWLLHLLEVCRSYPQPIVLSLVVSRELMRRLADRPAKLGSLTMRLMPLTSREAALCNHRVLAVSGLARWWVMRRYLELSRAKHGIFLSIDHASLPLACGLPFGGRTVSGILFRPSVHYRELGDYEPDWRERLRDLRKDLLYRRMLANPSVQSVLTLDPYFPQYARARYHDGAKVEPIPDPVNSVVPISWGDAKVARRFPDSRIRFLLFGDLTERKGVLVLLEALARLRPAIARAVAVMIAGRTDKNIKPKVLQEIEALARTQPDLWLQYEGRYLESGEVAALVARSDVVLAPYQRFVGSSGVLMWSARERKPVITQDYGLLGRLTREHRLGLAVDTTSPDALAAAIEQAVENGSASLADPARVEAFVSHRTPDRFAWAVIGAALAPTPSRMRLNGSISARSTVPK